MKKYFLEMVRKLMKTHKEFRQEAMKRKEGARGERI